MQYYLAMKRNELLTCATWVNESQNNWAEWKKQMRKKCIVYDPIYIKLKYESYSDRKRWGGEEAQGNFGICLLFSLRRFTGIYICQTIKLYILNIWSLLYVNYNSVKLFCKKNKRKTNFCQDVLWYSWKLKGQIEVAIIKISSSIWTKGSHKLLFIISSLR